MGNAVRGRIPDSRYFQHGKHFKRGGNILAVLVLFNTMLRYNRSYCIHLAGQKEGYLVIKSGDDLHNQEGKSLLIIFIQNEAWV